MFGTIAAATVVVIFLALTSYSVISDPNSRSAALLTAALAGAFSLVLQRILGP